MPGGCLRKQTQCVEVELAARKTLVWSSLKVNLSESKQTTTRSAFNLLGRGDIIGLVETISQFLGVY